MRSSTRYRPRSFPLLIRSQPHCSTRHGSTLLPTSRLSVSEDGEEERHREHWELYDAWYGLGCGVCRKQGELGPSVQNSTVFVKCSRIEWFPRPASDRYPTSCGSRWPTSVSKSSTARPVCPPTFLPFASLRLGYSIVLNTEPRCNQNRHVLR